MYERSASVYDAIYLKQKNYQNEARKTKELIAREARIPGRRLLDIACGTGLHLHWLQNDFQVEGLDLQPEMVRIAQKRLPGIQIHQGDMTAFNLPASYDVILCLFSSIGYVGTYEKLVQSLCCMFHHLNPGGLLLVEPWFTPQDWQPNTAHAVFIDQPDLKIARVNTSITQGKMAVMDMHHLVGTPAETIHFVEHHELGLFERSEMDAAFLSCGFNVRYDPEGLSGRGLYIAHKPSTG